VALTADATQESRKACEEAGFDAYLSKPVEVKKLFEVLDSLVPTGREAHGVTTKANSPTARIPSSGQDGRGEIIDPATIDELATLGGEEDFLEKLIHLFLETGEQKVADIEKAQLSGKYVLVAELSHALKGSAGQIGATALVELCNRMSRIGPADLMEEGEKYVEALKEEFARVRAALQEFVDQGVRKRTSGVTFPPHTSYR
jgi:two-component system sensor histidine kinase RpfC